MNGLNARDINVAMKIIERSTKGIGNTVVN